MPFITGYDVLYTNTDVKDAPDTTLIDNPDGYPLGTRSSDAVNILARGGGAGPYMKATHMELIFTHTIAAGDADGTSSVLELMGSAEGGARELVCTIALTGGKARRTADSDVVRWCDTATVTNMRTTDVALEDNSATDGVARVRVKLQGLQFWEGLFTGAGSTAEIAICYYRLYSETE